MAQIKNTSHYQNIRKNHIIHKSEAPSWDGRDRDADYNIKEGLTFGFSQEQTLVNQGWKG